VIGVLLLSSAIAHHDNAAGDVIAILQVIEWLLLLSANISELAWSRGWFITGLMYHNAACLSSCCPSTVDADAGDTSPRPR